MISTFAAHTQLGEFVQIAQMPCQLSIRNRDEPPSQRSNNQSIIFFNTAFEHGIIR